MSLDLSQPRDVTFLVLFAALALFVLHSPKLAVLVMLAVIYANLSEIGIRRFDAPSILQVMVLFFVAVIARQILLERTSRIVVAPIFWCIGLYAAAIVWSSLDAVSVRGADKVLAQLIVDVMLVYIIVTFVTSDDMLRRSVWVLVGTGAVLAAIGLAQVATESHDFDYYGLAKVKHAHIHGKIFQPRLSGPLSDPTFYAQSLAVLLPLAFYRVIAEPTRFVRGLAAAAFLVILLALVLTYSRAALLVAGVIMTTVLIHIGLKFRYWLMLSAIAVLALLIAPSDLIGRFASLGQLVGVERQAVFTSESALQQRKLYMAAAVEMFREQPYLGVGAGNYGTEFPNSPVYFDEFITSYKQTGIRRSAHSLYLEIAAETGIAGLLAFAAIIAAVAYSLIRAYRHFAAEGEREAKLLVASIGFAVASYLATSLSLHSSYLRYWWLLVALSIAAERIASRQAGTRSAGVKPAGGPATGDLPRG